MYKCLNECAALKFLFTSQNKSPQNQWMSCESLTFPTNIYTINEKTITRKMQKWYQRFGSKINGIFKHDITWLHKYESLFSSP